VTMPWGVLGGKTKEQQNAEWEMQKMEYQGVSNIINKLAGKCFERCAQNVSISQLSTAEMLCLDRCTAKYIHAINTVSIRTQEISGKYAV